MEIHLVSTAVPFALHLISHITQLGLLCQSLGHCGNKAQLHLHLPGSCSITKTKVVSVRNTCSIRFINLNNVNFQRCRYTCNKVFQAVCPALFNLPNVWHQVHKDLLWAYPASFNHFLKIYFTFPVASWSTQALHWWHTEGRRASPWRVWAPGTQQKCPPPCGDGWGVLTPTFSLLLCAVRDLWAAPRSAVR